MDWGKLLSTKRLGAEDAAARKRPVRSEFESDVDRLVFSTAFRRLAGKTQVHPLASNDHIHSRLTHSIEVSRVGNTLGKLVAERMLSLPNAESQFPHAVKPDHFGSIVQAACIAHDFGNPPFGHAGEAEISHWFSDNEISAPLKNGSRATISNALSPEELFDIKIYEGNAQGFRFVSQIENNIFSGGFRLTYATLGSFHKYPWSSKHRSDKVGFYLSELDVIDNIFSDIGLFKKSENVWSRHPLAHLVEAADDICYSVIDLEDAVELKIISFDEVFEILEKIIPDEDMRARLVDNRMHRVNFSLSRGRIVETSINAVCDCYMSNYEKIMMGDMDDGLISNLDDGHPVKVGIGKAKELAKEKVFSDNKKMELEIGSYAVYDILLRNFCGASLSRALELQGTGSGVSVGWFRSRILNLLGDHAPRHDNPPPTGWCAYNCLRRSRGFYWRYDRQLCHLSCQSNERRGFFRRTSPLNATASSRMP